MEEKVEKKKNSKVIWWIVGVFLLICVFGGDSSRETSNVVSMQNEVSYLKGQVQNLTKEKEELINDSNVTSLENIISEKDNIIKNLENTVSDTRSRITELEKEVLDKENEIEELGESVNTLKEEKSELEDKVTSLSSTSKSSSSKTTSTTKTTTTSSSSTTNSYTVYITNTGGKYHRDGCSYLRSSKIAIDKSSAIAQGKGACSRCNP